MHVSVALADVHIIADTDNVSHERDHVSCFTYSLAMGNLRSGIVIQCRVARSHSSKQGNVYRRIFLQSKRETGTGRIIAE